MSLSRNVIEEITSKISSEPGDAFELKLDDGRVACGFRGTNALEMAKKAFEKTIMPISGIEEIVTGTYVFLA